MRLPRRVPWASLSELDEVCSWIYTDETDLEAKVRAVNRISAWKAITHIPHALEATLTLLSAILLDEECIICRQAQQEKQNETESSLPRFGSCLALNVRQSYAMALVRMVNGLVDPLQLGVYARPISSIATQIGLPMWLVELRHSATHEELPSLEVLRTAARESLSWLLHNYFMPTLQSSSSDQGSSSVQLSPLTPLLKEYKSIQKTVTRDSSLKSQYKGDIARIIRDIERWVGEAKVAASAMMFQGWGTIDKEDVVSDNEKWGLERLCGCLLERGGLVPVSSKKRLETKSKDYPKLPTALIAIWTPLLDALVSNHPSLPSVLLSSISNILISGVSTTDSQKIDLSFDLCLAAWGAWCVDHWEIEQIDSGTNDSLPLNREDIVVNLITILGGPVMEEISHRHGARAFLNLLVHDYPPLRDISASLLSLQLTKGQGEQSMDDNEECLKLMEGRLHSLLSSTVNQTDQDNPMEIEGGDASPILHDDLPTGWTKISIADWKPCPIGVWPY